MNRKLRRMHERNIRQDVKKSVSSGECGSWEDITIAARQRICPMTPEKIGGYWKNNAFTAQVLYTTIGTLLGIRRNDESPKVTWADKQRIKNEIVGEESQAIEIFPKVSELVDDANMYWLWVMPVDADLKFALREVYGRTS